MLQFLKRIRNRLKGEYWKFKLKHADKQGLKNAILLESVPDLSDNTKAVFDELIRRKINKHVKLIWLVNDQQRASYKRIKNVLYVSPWSLEAKYYGKLAKVKICCNGFLTKETDGQLCFYLSHGTAIKNVSGFYTVPEGIDYFLTASKNVVELQSKVFRFPKGNMVPLGFPRNDVLGKQCRNIRDILKTQCQHIIVWYPTYRQSKTGRKTGSSNALPIIFTPERAALLNDKAKQNNTLIVIKPHFVQDTSYIQDMKLSNICFISDAFFEENNISAYAFLGGCDALITDYSSVYFDYTLCNKPIAAVWEDIEAYKENPGLVDDYDYLMKGAEKVYTLDDLLGFVQRIADGVDLLQTEREEIRDYANISTDSRNSERVVDFIGKKSKLF